MNFRVSVAAFAFLLFYVYMFGQSVSVAQEYLEPASVPAAIALHSGQVSVLRVHAAGYQVYRCSTVNGAPAWTLAGPDANLFDAKQTLVGTHFASASGAPSWRLTDGSEIAGKKVAAAPSPDASAVPWLLVAVAAHSGKTGILTDITAVQRVNTVGGTAPATGCEANTQGRIAKSPYTADYYFSK